MWRKYTDTEKNYPCDKCDKIFSRRNSLVRHIAERRSEIEYKCEICEKIYWVKKGYIDFTPNICRFHRRILKSLWGFKGY